MTSDRRRVLAIIPLPQNLIAQLENAYNLSREPKGWKEIRPSVYADVQVLLTNGTTGASAEQLAVLPKLGLVCAFGAGFEGIDIKAARQANIQVTHAPGINDETVADHAIGLALALARDIPARSAALLGGAWSEIRSSRPTLSNSKVGIFGLGNIGRRIAHRAEAFGASIFYCNRSEKSDVAWSYVRDLSGLAREVDFLFISCPGGHATRHAVNSPIFDALGPAGFLVNVSRGSVVATDDLIEALNEKRIAGAALDVFENEPDISERLLASCNLVATPHMAGRSPSSEQKQIDLLLENISAFFSSEPLLTPVG